VANIHAKVVTDESGHAGVRTRLYRQHSSAAHSDVALLMHACHAT